MRICSLSGSRETPKCSGIQLATLWIVDEGTLYRVEAGIWRAEVVDPESGTVPTRIGALVK
ncbi:hypothetical protein GS933_25270 [Rhodococcus hoagii]|nr:hypothetical protein [Prescottella equi]